MKNLKSVGEWLSASDHDEELYTSDTRKRRRRAKKGLFSRGEGCFDFIYLIRSWDKIVGKLMAQNTIPHKINRSTLIIMTKHTVFAQELSFMGPQIIQKIEEHIPELKGKISKIKFSHANFSWEEFKNSKSQNRDASVEKPRLHPQSPQYKLAIKKAQELFSDIEDQEVKELLTKLFLEKL